MNAGPWYYECGDGNISPPTSLDELRELHRREVISNETLVWHWSLGAWTQYDQISRQPEATASPPPPPPPLPHKSGGGASTGTRGEMQAPSDPPGASAPVRTPEPQRPATEIPPTPALQDRPILIVAPESTTSPRCSLRRLAVVFAIVAVLAALYAWSRLGARAEQHRQAAVITIRKQLLPELEQLTRAIDREGLLKNRIQDLMREVASAEAACQSQDYKSALGMYRSLEAALPTLKNDYEAFRSCQQAVKSALSIRRRLSPPPLPQLARPLTEASSALEAAQTDIRQESLAAAQEKTRAAFATLTIVSNATAAHSAFKNAMRGIDVQLLQKYGDENGHRLAEASMGKATLPEEPSRLTSLFRDMIQELPAAITNALLARAADIALLPAHLSVTNLVWFTPSSNSNKAITHDICITDGHGNSALALMPDTDEKARVFTRRLLGEGVVRNPQIVAETPSLALRDISSAAAIHWQSTNSSLLPRVERDASNTNALTISFFKDANAKPYHHMQVQYLADQFGRRPIGLTVINADGTNLPQPAQVELASKQINIPSGPLFEEQHITDLNAKQTAAYKLYCEYLSHQLAHAIITNIPANVNRGYSVSIDLLYRRGSYVQEEGDKQAPTRRLAAVVSFKTKPYPEATRDDGSTIPIQVSSGPDQEAIITFPRGFRANQLENYAHLMVKEAERIVYPSGARQNPIERVMYDADGTLFVLVNMPRDVSTSVRGMEIYTHLVTEGQPPKYPDLRYLHCFLLTLRQDDAAKPFWEIQSAVPNRYRGSDAFVCAERCVNRQGRTTRYYFPDSGSGNMFSLGGLQLVNEREY